MKIDDAVPMLTRQEYKDVKEAVRDLRFEVLKANIALDSTDQRIYALAKDLAAEFLKVGWNYIEAQSILVVLREQLTSWATDLLSVRYDVSRFESEIEYEQLKDLILKLPESLRRMEQNGLLLPVVD